VGGDNPTNPYLSLHGGLKTQKSGPRRYIQVQWFFFHDVAEKDNRESEKSHGSKSAKTAFAAKKS